MIHLKKKIVGFECVSINNSYSYPRSKLSDPLSDTLKGLNLFFKHKNRYYCKIDKLFIEIYKITYNENHIKNYLIRNYIDNIIKTTAEKFKEVTLIRELNNVRSYMNIKDGLYNHECIELGEYVKLRDSTNVCCKSDITEQCNNEYVFSYYTYQIKDSFIIFSEMTTSIYRFETAEDNRYYLCNSTGYNFTGYNSRNIYISQELNSIICLKCKSDSLHMSHYNNNYSAECRKCDNGWGCGRDCTELLGEVRGDLIKCTNCKYEYEYDFNAIGNFGSYSIKYKLDNLFIKQYNDYLISNFTKIFNVYNNYTINPKLEYLIKDMDIEKIKKNRRLHNKIDYNKNFMYLLKNKTKLLNTKMIYANYKNNYLTCVYTDDPSYIQFLLSHNYELDTNKTVTSYGSSRKKIKKSKKSKTTESDFNKIFRYLLNIPHDSCDKYRCTNIGIYGDDNNQPYRCSIHKSNKHIIVKTTNCMGVDGICPYGCLTGNRKYDNYCTQCFIHLFPNDIRVKDIRSKTKEITVINYICNNFEGIWHHDKPLYYDFDGGCCPSKRRIDLRQMFNNTMLCIEIDENQHKTYCSDDEFIRYNDIICDLTCKYIFIRYNPDKYKEYNKIKNPSDKERFEILNNKILEEIKRINNNMNIELLEIKYLFYDK